jgi:hypothetical protein
VAARGCNTHTQRAAAEAERSRRACRASLGTKGAGASAGPNRGFAGMSPQRWIGSAAPQGKEPETVSPPGAAQYKASNTARGTPEKWRTCGVFGRGFIEKHRPASVSRETEARGSRQASPAIQDPGVPRRPHFGGALDGMTRALKRAARTRRAGSAASRTSSFLNACSEETKAERNKKPLWHTGIVPSGEHVTWRSAPQ